MKDKVVTVAKDLDELKEALSYRHFLCKRESLELICGAYINTKLTNFIENGDGKDAEVFAKTEIRILTELKEFLTQLEKEHRFRWYDWFFTTCWSAAKEHYLDEIKQLKTTVDLYIETFYQALGKVNALNQQPSNYNYLISSCSGYVKLS